MDYALISSIILPCIFVFVPSILLTMYIGENSALTFILFAMFFSVIGLFAGIVPMWFLGLDLLGVAVLMYQTIFSNRGNSNE